mgnify:CR=1 FL=1
MTRMSLEVKDLVSGYGKVEVVHGVNLKAEETKITGIIGPNGSGKSTILKSIYGYLKPWRGSVIFDGQNVTGRPTHLLKELGISYVMQRRSVFPYLTVEENLRMGAWIFRDNKKKVKDAINDIYERFPRLKERRNLRTGSLSGGEQRMIELGRAMMTKPKLILLDEFSTGLSPKIFKELYHHLIDMSRREGVTILAVDQNVVEIANVADYLYVLKLGRNHGEGPIEDFRCRLDEVTKDWLR